MEYHYEVAGYVQCGPDDVELETVWEGNSMREAIAVAKAYACSKLYLVMSDNGHVDWAELPLVP